MRASVLAVAAALLIFALLPRPAGAEPVERIAAVVNGRILFLSDLERDRLFFEMPAKEAEEGPDRRERLNRLIDQRLFLAEAHRFVLQGPSDGKIEERLKQVRGRFKNEEAFREALRRTAFSPEELREEVRARLWVEKLIQERIRFFVFITPQDIERYYQEHANEFSGEKMEEVEPKIRAVLTKEKETAKEKDYLKRLRSRAEIQVNLD